MNIDATKTTLAELYAVALHLLNNPERPGDKERLNTDTKQLRALCAHNAEWRKRADTLKEMVIARPYGEISSLSQALYLTD